MKYLFPLLLFFLQASIAWSQAGAPSQRDCELRAYVNDPDPKGLNLRSGPNPKSPVSAVIPKDPDGTIVEIRASRGSWLMLVSAETIESKEVFRGRAWAFAPLLATMLRNKAKIYAQADEKSKTLGTLAAEDEVALAGCEGNWPKVKKGNLEGYLPPEASCPNPVTTCP